MKPLPRRQREVLALAANGHTNQQIGARLHISATTVNAILRNAYRSLGVHDRTHAVTVALATGQLDLRQIIIPGSQRSAA